MAQLESVVWCVGTAVVAEAIIYALQSLAADDRRDTRGHTVLSAVALHINGIFFALAISYSLAISGSTLSTWAAISIGASAPSLFWRINQIATARLRSRYEKQRSEILEQAEQLARARTAAQISLLQGGLSTEAAEILTDRLNELAGQLPTASGPDEEVSH